MPDPGQIHEGGCRCGAVRDRATAAPHATTLCHCRSCRLSAIVSGEVAIHESSPGVERGFCRRCGTSLTYTRANRPGFFDVTTASLDDPDALPPTKEIWTRERLSWLPGNPDLPQFDEFSTPPTTG